MGRRHSMLRFLELRPRNEHYARGKPFPAWSPCLGAMVGCMFDMTSYTYPRLRRLQTDTWLFQVNVRVPVRLRTKCNVFAPKVYTVRSDGFDQFVVRSWEFDSPGVVVVPPVDDRFWYVRQRLLEPGDLDVNYVDGCMPVLPT